MTSSLVVNHRPVEATKGWSCQQTIQFLGWIVWEFIRPSDIIWPYLTIRTYKREFECSKPWNIWRVPMMAKWFDPPGGWKTPGLSRIHQRRSQWEDWSLEQQISAFRNLELQLESHLTCVCVCDVAWCWYFTWIYVDVKKEYLRCIILYIFWCYIPRIGPAEDSWGLAGVRHSLRGQHHVWIMVLADPNAGRWCSKFN